MNTKRISAAELLQAEIVEKIEGRRPFYIGGVFKGMRITGDVIFVTREQFEAANVDAVRLKLLSSPSDDDGSSSSSSE